MVLTFDAGIIAFRKKEGGAANVLTNFTSE
jgi:hypothetical protein